jgi:hypothetical protein
MLILPLLMVLLPELLELPDLLAIQAELPGPLGILVHRV